MIPGLKWLDMRMGGMKKLVVGSIFTLDLPPTQDAIVANEGLGWDSRS